MAIEVFQYTEEMKRVWDRFVWNSNNGTLFHTRQFLNYHPPGRFQDHSLLFKEKGCIVAVLPAAFKTVDARKILYSHCGASYGGFVYREDLPVRSAFDLVKVLLAHLKEEKIERVEMTLPPVVYHARPSHYVDFALYKSGFSYKKREVSSIIPLDFSADQILEKFKPEARTAYRKSLKSGIRVVESEDVESFYSILKKNLSMRHNVKPTHTLEELKRLKALFPERIRHFGAFLENRMVAGVTNFICNDRVVLAFYISHDEAYQKFRPVNHLFYEIIRWAIAQGYRFLDFGIFTVDEDPNWGLAKFKESFGARGILRDTFYRDLSERDHESIQ